MAASFLEDDMKAVFSSDVFGEEDGITWNGVVIEDVIFDDEDIEVETGDGVAEIMSQPMLTGSTEDFAGIKRDDPIQIKGQQYTVRNWKNDGTGVIEIFLSKVKS